MVWDFEKKSLRFKFSEHDHAVQCVAFSHDDKLLLSCGNTLDGKVFFWDMSTGAWTNIRASIAERIHRIEIMLGVGFYNLHRT